MLLKSNLREALVISTMKSLSGQPKTDAERGVGGQLLVPCCRSPQARIPSGDVRGVLEPYFRVPPVGSCLSRERHTPWQRKPRRQRRQQILLVFAMGLAGDSRIFFLVCRSPGKTADCTLIVSRNVPRTRCRFRAGAHQGRLVRGRCCTKPVTLTTPKEELPPYMDEAGRGMIFTPAWSGPPQAGTPCRS
jgi:hypothetical protein